MTATRAELEQKIRALLERHLAYFFLDADPSVAAELASLIAQELTPEEAA